MKHFSIIILILTSLFSCKQNRHEKIINKLQKIPLIKEDETFIQSLEKNTSLLKSAKNIHNSEVFIEKVLGKNAQKKEILKSNINLDHLQLFQKTGLNRIICYFDRTYPKYVEPTNYEHFVLFNIVYDHKEDAKESYETLKELCLEIKKKEKQLSEDEQQLIFHINHTAKSGGMIYQNDKHIFSLVETCKENHLGSKWIEYERFFIDHFTSEKTNVLNSDCGDIKYTEEIR